MQKWYHKTSVVIIALLSVGPLALPLVWFNPKYSVNKKVIITAVVVILSYLLWVMMSSSLKVLREYYKQVLP